MKKYNNIKYKIIEKISHLKIYVKKKSVRK